MNPAKIMFAFNQCSHKIYYIIFFMGEGPMKAKVSTSHGSHNGVMEIIVYSCGSWSVCEQMPCEVCLHVCLCMVLKHCLE